MFKLARQNFSALARNYEILSETYISYNEQIKFLEEKKRLVLLRNTNCNVCHGKGYFHEKIKLKCGKIVYKDKDCYVCYR